MMEPSDELRRVIVRAYENASGGYALLQGEDKAIEQAVREWIAERFVHVDVLRPIVAAIGGTEPGLILSDETNDAIEQLEQLVPWRDHALDSTEADAALGQDYTT